MPAGRLRVELMCALEALRETDVELRAARNVMLLACPAVVEADSYNPFERSYDHLEVAHKPPSSMLQQLRFI